MSDAPRSGRFVTTHWSLVLRAGGETDAGSAQALARLCELYWYPVYAFVRRQGHSADEASDLTQEFFLRVLEKSYLRAADPERGRFRSFLLSCLRHFLSNERDRAATLKRGGACTIVPLETDTAEGRYLREPREDLTPEKVFDRRWAVALIDRALARLRHEQIARGRQKSFETLKVFLTGEADETSHRDAAKALETTESAIKAALHRLRRRFRSVLTEEVASTVADPGDVEDEIRYLLQAVSQ